MIDDVAREAYRRRLRDVDDDIEEAVRLNDLGRQVKAEADRDYLVAELSRAVGLGGRGRTVGGSSERARTSVARSLRYALAEVASRHPPAAGGRAPSDESAHRHLLLVPARPVRPGGLGALTLGAPDPNPTGEGSWRRPD